MDRRQPRVVRLNDVDFHVEIDGQGPPLLLLHGFTGSSRAWDDVRRDLAGRATVIAVDLIGHGQTESPPDPERYSLECCAQDLLALLDALQIQTIDLLGYSMGGRVALYLACHAPQRVKQLILESASPGLEDSAERERRVQSDGALADRIVRDGIVAFVDEWERQPLLAPASHVPAEIRRRQHDQRLQNRALGLANSLRGMGTGKQAPLWSNLGALTMPVMLIAGAEDERYCAIAERMLALLPRARLAVVPHAGHTVHVDQPRRFLELICECIENKLT